MKKEILFLLLFMIASVTFAQQYKSHKVVKGENVFRIAKRYNVTVESIYDVNPSAKEGIQEGQVLVIPIEEGDQKEYKVHEVVAGDTVFNISQRYNTTQDAIFTLNPEARNGINIGQILKVAVLEKPTEQNTIETDKTDPAESIVEESVSETTAPVIDSVQKEDEKKVVGFKTHKVKRKETLYGIGRSYGVTVEEIKRHNKRLYAEDIKKKDQIRIPVFEEGSAEEQNPTVTIGSRVTTTTKYTIKPKETKFGIARRHGITMSELDNLNPDLDPSFRVGQQITVPTTVFIPHDKQLVDPGFELYEVPPKQTIYRILKFTGISSDSLMKMNPYLKDGLKEGMVITIPNTTQKDSLNTIVPVSEKEIVPLDKMLYNFKTKKIAVMLPFNLDSVNLELREKTENYLKGSAREARGLRVALDFYKGVLLAIDSAKTKGISTELSVYDTKKNRNEPFLKKLIAENNFDELDAVIGPLYQANVELVASELRKYEVPVFSPISKKESKVFSNFFQTRPTDEMLSDKLISYVEKDSLQKQIVLIVQNGKKFESIKQKLVQKFPEAKVAKIEAGNYLYKVNLDRVLSSKTPNWVFLESDDVAFISNVVPLLNAKAESHKITLFTTKKTSAFESDYVSNNHLSKLHLHYPSVDKEYNNDDQEVFTPLVSKFYREHGVIPNKYVVRGFDVTYDTLMRLGAADDLYHAAATFTWTTEYLENKFNYTKNLSGGYYNKASYLIKFDDDLKLSVIE